MWFKEKHEKMDPKYLTADELRTVGFIDGRMNKAPYYPNNHSYMVGYMVDSYLKNGGRLCRCK